jgi:regulation of enolase protein 1 (concanavalin A-like superfamily)
VEAVPFPLHWLNEPLSWTEADGGLSIVAGPQTDWFVDPAGGDPVMTAPALLGAVEGDFTLSARVEVEFAASFDAGVLVLYRDDGAWAKLCFEYAPDGEPMVVSVVTRGVSDDANSFVVAGDGVWLRIARSGGAFAFHASLDGTTWRFVRHFALDEPERFAVGFEAQAPTGEGCAVRFTDVRFERRTLGDLRDGS